MFTYGCDPELFVKNAKGKFISAHGLIPGNKATPFKVDGGAVQVDGMAVEFNIDPVDNVVDWEVNITRVLEALHDMLPGCTLVAEPSIRFTKGVWEKTPDEAKELGCDPDFNAYTATQNPRPDNIPQLRGAGGHVHIGWRKEADIDITNEIHLMNCQKLIKQLDRYVGFPSLKYDMDKRRRKMYGMAGAFRPKPYGVEYRTLSNFWALDPELRAWVFNQTKMAVEHSLPGVQFATPRGKSMSIYNYWLYKVGRKNAWTLDDFMQEAIVKPSGRTKLDYYLADYGFVKHMVNKDNTDVTKEYSCAVAA